MKAFEGPWWAAQQGVTGAKMKKVEGTQEIRKYTELCCSDCGGAVQKSSPQLTLTLAQQSLD